MHREIAKNPVKLRFEEKVMCSKLVGTKHDCNIYLRQHHGEAAEKTVATLAWEESEMSNFSAAAGTKETDDCIQIL